MSTVKTNQLMLFKETIFYYENSYETYTDSMQNTEIFNVKAGGTYSNHCTLKGLG